MNKRHTVYCAIGACSIAVGFLLGIFVLSLPSSIFVTFISARAGETVVPDCSNVDPCITAGCFHLCGSVGNSSSSIGVATVGDVACEDVPNPCDFMECHYLCDGGDDGVVQMGVDCTKVDPCVTAGCSHLCGSVGHSSSSIGVAAVGGVACEDVPNPCDFIKCYYPCSPASPAAPTVTAGTPLPPQPLSWWQQMVLQATILLGGSSASPPQGVVPAPGPAPVPVAAPRVPAAASVASPQPAAGATTVAQPNNVPPAPNAGVGGASSSASAGPDQVPASVITAPGTAAPAARSPAAPVPAAPENVASPARGRFDVPEKYKGTGQPAWPVVPEDQAVRHAAPGRYYAPEELPETLSPLGEAVGRFVDAVGGFFASAFGFFTGMFGR